MPGTNGSWDDANAGQPKVLFDGTTFHMWYYGTSLSVPNIQIGYATAPNDSIQYWFAHDILALSSAEGSERFPILANDIHPGCPDALDCIKGPCIKKGVQIGISSCVLPRVVIGEYSVIGAGSVVTKDIPAGVVAYGNPARVVGKIEDITCTTGLRDRPYDHLTGRIEDAYTVS